MTVRRPEMPGFQALKERLENWALHQLESTNHPYVETFKRRITETPDDLPKVITETAPLLKGPAPWHQLLTALLDVELYMDRCTRLPWYLNFPPSAQRLPPSEPGAWLQYQYDAWFLAIYALLDRIRTLIALTCRHILRPKSAYWAVVHTQLLADVDEAKKAMEYRHRVAHGGAILEHLVPENHWDPYLILTRVLFPTEPIDIITSYYVSLVSDPHGWSRQLLDSTIWLLAFLDARLEELAAEAFSEASANARALPPRPWRPTRGPPHAS